METFWYNNISVIFEPNKLKKYIPLNSYSKSEKLNSIVRLGFYISFLFIVFTFNINYLFIPIFCLVLTLIIYSNESKKTVKTHKKNIENYDNIKKDELIKKTNIDVDNYLEGCVLPSDNNPFMNILLTDKRDRKPACKTIRNKKIKKLVDNKFGQGLYKDINSVYDRENSQREFYTMPSTTTPNNQGDYANWLYKTPKTCKEGNGNQCVGNNRERLNGNSYQFI
tara:strand:- start:889 stop:1560 length:672 start_codon:yes stop_codon:yes gene_type:complete